MHTLETVFEYHDRTKHHPNRYAASLGYMDWATQPDPYRRFDGAKGVVLPLPSPGPEPTYAALFEPLPSEPLTLETLSVLLRYSLGLAAVKCIGSDCWTLRCNASSGNLHPTEGYVILPPIEGVSTQSVVAHYAPLTHSLELLHAFDTDVWSGLPEGSFLMGLTSIVWREAWKYGERAFRYTQLDAGHALRAAQISARLNGWHARLFDAFEADTLDTLLGLDQPARFQPNEEEIADALLLITPEKDVVTPDLIPLLAQCRTAYAGTANRLSPSQHPWEAITLVERATSAAVNLPVDTAHPPFSSNCGTAAEEVILTRRSARAMDFGRTHIDFESFTRLMQAARNAVDGFTPAASLILFVHDVETLEPGLYLYLLNDGYLESFKTRMRGDFLFRPAGEHLYLLEAGDFRAQAKFISCSQEIASDGAFSLGMLCEFAPQIERFGAGRYKSLYWECGAIGQQLYLEATSQGLSATGIGCFLDDVMHRLLGLEGNDFQSLYHLAIGYAIPDLRLQTKLPYSRR
ncbi:SagB/ThcOx family dehydrogenase [Sulfurimonas sp. HSL1-6]|uniref:SagB/ThcOx family dehydrogenase n=1 Tax=Thiomicrolovo immobilis TaxID=3131935 RepID=UPI0031F9942C